MKFASYQDFIHYLDSLGVFSMQLGLSRMETAINRLDLLPSPSLIIHVVGTNGKGSTSGYLEALARAHGLKTGLYTSPHLVSVRERIRVANKLLSEERFLEAANIVMGQCADIGLTYFELLTIMAMVIFGGESVECIILEAGLGGTHDATCAIPADFTVVTPIGMDHEQILGATLLDIARDKAGALGRCPALSGIQEPGVLKLLTEAAAPYSLTSLRDAMRGNGYAFISQGHVLTLHHCDLPGQPEYQLQNAALALLTLAEVCRVRDWQFEPSLCKQALAEATFPGRFHQRGKILLDGAHNPMGLAALCEALEAQNLTFDVLIFQSMRDKTLDQSLLARLADRVEEIVIPAMPEIERAWDAPELAFFFGHGARAVTNVAQALSIAEHKKTLICGSLYLVGACYAANPDFLSFWSIE